MESNMEGELPLRERHQLWADAFVELRVWRVPAPVPGSAHSYKYSLPYVVRGELDFGHFEEESFVNQGLSETLLLRLTH